MFHFLRSAAVQLRTTVIGVFASVPATFVDSGRGMRNRWPSAETSKVFQGPVCPEALFKYPESNSGRGAENSNVEPVAWVAAATTLPKLLLSI